MSKGYKFGFINKQGKKVIPIKYDVTEDSTQFIEGLMLVRWNGKSGFVNRKGKMIIPLKYDVTWYFNEGLALVGKEIDKELKFGFINKTGKVIIPLKYGALYRVGRY